MSLTAEKNKNTQENIIMRVFFRVSSKVGRDQRKRQSALICIKFAFSRTIYYRAQNIW